VNQAVIDGGRNPSYEGRFNEETPEMHLIRLAQARRIAALEGLLRALDSLTNPDENFDSSINPGPERDELLAAYTACKDVPR